MGFLLGYYVSVPANWKWIVLCFSVSSNEVVNSKKKRKKERKEKKKKEKRREKEKRKKRKEKEKETGERADF